MYIFKEWIIKKYEIYEGIIYVINLIAIPINVNDVKFMIFEGFHNK